MKEIRWLGTSLDDLKAFPVAAKQDAGYELHRVQNGSEPSNWKPMNSIGRGVKEIRITERGNQFRVIYLATRADAVYVLHSLKKKTQKTSKKDIDLAKARLKEVPDE